MNILKVHSKDVRLDETVDFEEIALATSGAVGADLANMMNEAAINAVKHGARPYARRIFLRRWNWCLWVRKRRTGS